MRPLERKHRERDARFLTSRERANLLQASHAGYLEVSQVRAILLFSLPGELARQELYRRHLRDEVVDVVLGEVPTVEQDVSGLLRRVRKVLRTCEDGRSG